MIRITRSDELPEILKQKIADVVDSEFGHIPFIQEIIWSKPDCTIIFSRNNKLLAFYNVIKRKVLCDGKTYTVAGINNVITLPAHRGNGYSTILLSSATNFLFDDLQVDYGLLLCAEELVPFYRRLGWYEVKSKVIFSQSFNKVRQWKAKAMLLTNDKKEFYPQEIDLCGLPW